MDISQTLQEFGTSLGLGLLVGLQRERSDSRFAGIRTFPLITLLGTLCGFLAIPAGGWVIASGLVALAAVIVVAKLTPGAARDGDTGLTSEIAMLVMFALGAYLPTGSTAVGVSVGAGVAVLLHLKPELHALAARIGDADFRAIMQFVLIAMVVLPVLPDRNFGPYQVLNLHKLWMMVVLIVGISLAGYIVYKFFGARAGTLVGGFLGGLISSTATTVAYSRRVAGSHAGATAAALVISIASTVVFGRVLVIVGVTAPGLFGNMAPPLAVLLGVLVLTVGILLLATRTHETGMPDQGNPSELKSALFFGCLFAAVLLAAAAAREHFGSRGLYVVAVLSGLTDMDAITLTAARLVREGQADSATGWRVIMVASLANLAFKAGTVLILGGRRLFAACLPFLLVTVITAVLLLIFWRG